MKDVAVRLQGEDLDAFERRLEQLWPSWGGRAPRGRPEPPPFGRPTMGNRSARSTSRITLVSMSRA
eukprot:3124710-Alexandrium_andersonii.AAC.1